MTEQQERDESKALTGEESSTTGEDQASEGTTEPERAADRPPSPKRSGALAWIALLVALAAVALAAYSYWTQWTKSETEPGVDPLAAEFEALAGRVEQVERRMGSDLEALRSELAELAEPKEDSGPSAAALAERIDELGVRLERIQGEQNTGLGGMRSRVEELESEVGRRLEQFDLRLSRVGSNLDQADHDLATRLLLMEVDSLFAIAQDRMALQGDAETARQAWQRGMERLSALEGGEFRALKQEAEREFERLQEFRTPDTAGQVGRLFAMAEAVGEWPVQLPQSARQEATEGSEDGWRNRISSVFGSLVKFESVDQEHLGPAEIEFARERIGTVMQTAAVALAQSRHELARQLIGEAISETRQVFDTGAAPVSDAVEWLEQLADEDRDRRPPELTASRAEISRLLGDVR